MRKEDRAILFGVIGFVAVGFVTWIVLKWNVVLSLLLAGIASGIIVYLMSKGGD